MDEGWIPGNPSFLFNSHFVHGNVDWLGKAHRFMNYRAKEVINTSFYDYCLKYGIKIPTAYRKTSVDKVNFRVAGYRSAAKYDRFQPIVDEEAWSMSFDFMAKHFYPFMCDSRIVEEDLAWEDMNKSSSCGYPWNLVYQNKRDFIDAKLSVIADFWEELADGRYADEHVPIWSSTCKVELRAIEKLKFFGAEFDKLRTFTASPIEHSVNANRMYIDQNNKFYDSAGKHWSFVGATKFHLGFDDAYRRLERHPNAYCLDETNYDASLFERLMYGARDFRWLCFRDEFKTRENFNRHINLYHSIVHSVIVLDSGELCQKHTGNPSGSTNTINDNTLNLYRLLAYSYVCLCKECDREPSYEDFHSNVEALLNGDDNTFTVSDDLNLIFNPRNIARVWGFLGVVTNPSDGIWEARLLSDCDFLSQKFVPFKGKMLPCPETEKVLCSLMYNSDLDDIRWHMLRALALRIDSWPNVECRRIISGYIDYLNVVYQSQLCGVVTVSGEEFSMLKIRSLYKNDYELEELYMGKEGSLNGVPSSGLFKNFINCSVVKQSSVQMVSRNNRRNRKLRDMAAAAGSLVMSNGVSIPGLPQRVPRRPNLNVAPPLPPWPPALAGGGNVKRKRRNRNRRRNRGIDGGNTGRIGLGMNASRSGPRNIPRIVSGDEYIADINGSASFAVTSYPINPGQSLTFPRLSKEAVLYEKYAVEMLEFYYKREVSEFATNGQAGKLMLSADFDASDAPPTTKQQVMDSAPHVDGMPCAPILELRLSARDCNDSDGKLHYVRPGGLPGAADIKTYDVGNLFVSTSGNTNGNLIGELHVRYRFRLEVPVLEPSNSAPANNSVAWFQSSAAEAGGATGVAANLLMATASTNGLSAVNTSGSIVLPPGNYLGNLDIATVNSASAAGVINFDVLKNNVSIRVAKPLYDYYTAVDEYTARLSYSFYFTSNGTDAFTFPVTVAYASGNETLYGNLVITAI